MSSISEIFAEEFATKLVSTWNDYLKYLQAFSGMPIFKQVGIEAISGGKHFRPRLAAAGLLLAKGQIADADIPTLHQLGCALEFFQASALAHDDIIDNSLTRRGLPTAFVRFSDWHHAHALSGSSLDYGRHTALLLGNYLQVCSSQSFYDAAASSASPQSFVGEAYRMMCTVNYGQYLDIRLEGLPTPPRVQCERVEQITRLLGLESTAQIQAALEVMFTKTASYTGIYPLVLGILLHSDSPELLAAGREVGLRAGMAFQITDDLLGLFGQSERTGKPVGDDLREGKRTLLLALARSRMNTAQEQALDEVLGNHDASAEQLEQVIALVESVGARETCQELSVKLADDALRIAQCHFQPAGVQYVRELLEQIVYRDR